MKFVAFFLALCAICFLLACGGESPMGLEEPESVASADSDTTFVKSRFQSRYSLGDGGPVSGPLSK